MNQVEIINPKGEPAVNNAFSNYICVLSAEILYEPVVAEDGDTYEDAAFKEFVNKTKPPLKSPSRKINATNGKEEISPHTLPNGLVKRLVNELLELHPESWADVYLPTYLLENARAAIINQDYDALLGLLKKHPRLLFEKVDKTQSSGTMIEFIFMQLSSEKFRDFIKEILTPYKKYIIHHHNRNAKNKQFECEALFTRAVARHAVRPDSGNIKSLSNLFDWGIEFYYYQAQVAIANNNLALLEVCFVLDEEMSSPQRLTSLLWDAVGHGSREILSKLLGHSKCTDEERQSQLNFLLRLAVIKQRDDIVQFLFNEGADVLALNSENQTATEVAVRKGTVKSLELLLQSSKLNGEERRSHIDYLLRVAVESQRPEMVKCLLTEGANSSAVILGQPLAVELAANLPSEETFKLLAPKEDKWYGLLKLLCSPSSDLKRVVNIGNRLNWDESFYQKCAFSAIEQADLNVLGVCCLLGINLNQSSKNKKYKGKTLLHLAIEKKFAVAVELLLNAGAYVDIPNRQNQTAQQMAQSSDQESIRNLAPLMVTRQSVSHPEQPQAVSSVSVVAPRVQFWALAKTGSQNIPHEKDLEIMREIFINKLFEIVSKDKSAPNRKGALKVLNGLKIKSEEMKDLLKKSLADKDTDVNKEAGRGMANFSDDHALQTWLLAQIYDFNRKEISFNHEIYPQAILYALRYMKMIHPAFLTALYDLIIKCKNKDIVLEAVKTYIILYPHYSSDQNPSRFLDLLRGEYEGIFVFAILHLFHQKTIVVSPNLIEIIIDAFIKALAFKENNKIFLDLIRVLTHYLSSPAKEYLINKMFKSRDLVKVNLYKALLNSPDDQSRKNCLALLKILDSAEYIRKCLLGYASDTNGNSAARANAIDALVDFPDEATAQRVSVLTLRTKDINIESAAIRFIQSVAAPVKVHEFKSYMAELKNNVVPRLIYRIQEDDEGNDLSPAERVDAIKMIGDIRVEDFENMQSFYDCVCVNRKILSVDSNFMPTLVRTLEQLNNEQLNILFLFEIAEHYQYYINYHHFSTIGFSVEAKKQILDKALILINSDNSSQWSIGIQALRLTRINTPDVISVLQKVIKGKRAGAHYLAAIALIELDVISSSLVAELSMILDPKKRGNNCNPSLLKGAIKALSSEKICTQDILDKLIDSASAGALEGIDVWDAVSDAAGNLYSAVNELKVVLSVVEAPRLLTSQGIRTRSPA